MSSKPFTAERQRRVVSPELPGDPAGALGQILAHLDEMQRRLNMVDGDESQADPEEAEAPPEPLAMSIGSVLPEITDVRVVHTLSELSVLRRKGEDDRDPFAAAALELDEVVRSTENATFTILDAVEAVEGMIDDIAGLVGGNSVVAELISQAQGRLAGIYQASGFQDLTGQRLGKVARTLRFLDERIARLEEVWTADGVELPPPAVEDAVDDESHLLNGPQSDEEALSQDDIDAMFD